MFKTNRKLRWELLESTNEVVELRQRLLNCKNFDNKPFIELNTIRDEKLLFEPDLLETMVEREGGTVIQLFSKYTLDRHQVKESIEEIQEKLKEVGQ